MASSSREILKLRRVRRIRSQVEAVERALENEIGFSDVLELIAGARSALNGLLTDVLDDYIRTYIVNSSEAERAYAAVELLDVIRSCLIGNGSVGRR